MRVEKCCRLPPPYQAVEIHGQNLVVCILAGGRSSRMGREKGSLLLGGETFLQRIERTVRSWTPSVKVEIVTEDLVEKCGPIGGVLTSFARFEAEWFLFLSCDMPFVSPALLNELTTIGGTLPVNSNIQFARFYATEEGAGFPFLLHDSTRSTVEAQHQKRRYSLQNLARELNVTLISAQQVGISSVELMNINTPEDFVAAKAIFEKTKRR